MDIAEVDFEYLVAQIANLLKFLCVSRFQIHAYIIVGKYHSLQEKMEAKIRLWDSSSSFNFLFLNERR